MIYRILGFLGCLLAGIALFHALFFKLAPFLAGFVQSDVAKVIIYGLIGWFGGLTIPIALIGIGIFILFAR